MYRGSVLYSGADEETEAGVDVTALNSLAGYGSTTNNLSLT